MSPTDLQRSMDAAPARDHADEGETTAAKGNRHDVWLGLGATLAFLACLSTLLWFEETSYVGRLGAVLAILTLLFGLAAIVGRLANATLLAILLVGVLVIASRTKIHYLDVPLMAGDFVYLTGHSLWVTAIQYKSLAITALIALAAAAGAIIWIVRMPGPKLDPKMRLACLVMAGLIASWIPGVANVSLVWDPNAKGTRGAVSTFTTSLAAVAFYGTGKVTFADVGPFGLEHGFQPAAASALAADRPDIVMILDESLFDPRVHDLPVQKAVVDHLEPEGGLSGSLGVSVLGGSTWVSEFAAMTGIDTRAFGDQAYYLPILMENRVHHSLISHMKAIGYEVHVIYCMDGAFMNAENNYRALGADRFEGPGEKKAPGKIWIQRDRKFFQRAVDHIEEVRRTSGKPVFSIVVTIYNHGSHGDPGYPVDGHEEARAWIEQSAPGPDMMPYRDFYMRLQNSMADYSWLRTELARRPSGTRTILARYGDHQPQFTKVLVDADEEADRESIYVTPFSIEAINGALSPIPDWGGGTVDIAYLPSLVLAAAGLPLDTIFKAREELMQRCQGQYQKCTDPLKGRIHRTLVDDGLIEVDDTLPQDGDRIALVPR